jgi:hypothetical protein
MTDIQARASGLLSYLSGQDKGVSWTELVHLVATDPLAWLKKRGYVRTLDGDRVRFAVTAEGREWLEGRGGEGEVPPLPARKTRWALITASRGDGPTRYSARGQDCTAVVHGAAAMIVRARGDKLARMFPDHGLRNAATGFLQSMGYAIKVGGQRAGRGAYAPVSYVATQAGELWAAGVPDVDLWSLLDCTAEEKADWLAGRKPAVDRAIREHVAATLNNAGQSHAEATSDQAHRPVWVPLETTWRAAKAWAAVPKPSRWSAFCMVFFEPMLQGKTDAEKRAAEKERDAMVYPAIGPHWDPDNQMSEPYASVTDRPALERIIAAGQATYEPTTTQDTGQTPGDVAESVAAPNVSAAQTEGSV